MNGHIGIPYTSRVRTKCSKTLKWVILFISFLINDRDKNIFNKTKYYNINSLLLILLTTIPNLAVEKGFF